MTIDQVKRAVGQSSDMGIVDGWGMATTVNHLPYNYESYALDRMSELRTSNAHRHVWVCGPDNITTAIAAYDTVQTQVFVTPGSWIYGLAIVELNDDYSTSDGVSSMIQITDACTGLPLFAEHVIAKSYWINPDQFITGSYIPVTLPRLLAEPRCVAHPGDINIQIANITAFPVRTQVVLAVAEPMVPMGVNPAAEAGVAATMLGSGAGVAGKRRN